MNKTIKRTFISVICLLISLMSLTAFTLMGGCYSPSNPSTSQNSGNKPNEQPDSQASISFSVSEKMMLVGDEEYLIPDYNKLSGYSLTYSSSASQVVSVSNQGKLSAQGEGNAVITATYSNGSDSASASVTVSTSFGGYLPELKTMGVEGNIAIAVNSSYKVLPYVSFNGKQFSDATISYTVIDQNVAQVSENGEITAKAKGSTQLVIEASWRGKDKVEAPTLQKVVELSVIDDVRFFNDGELVSDETLYTFASFDGKSYKNNLPCDFTVLVNGVESVAEVTIENEEIVKKQGDSIAVVGYGSTNVLVQSTVSGETYSKTFAITVNRVEKTITTTVPLFSTVDGSYLDQEEGQTKDLLSFVNDGDELIDAYQGLRALTVLDGKVLGVESSSQTKRGSAEISVGTEKVIYHFTLETLAKAISTKEDLKALELVDGAILTGYYELVNDIDASGINLNHVKTNGACFSGVFDGNGYSVENLSLSQPANANQNASGLFGILNGTAIVKNFALVNLNATKVYFLASNTLNDGLTISNVYISLSQSTATPRGLTGRTGSSSVCTNVVIEYLGANAEADRVYNERWNWQGLIGGLWTYESNGMLYAQDKKWSDVYVISPFTVSFRSDEKKDGDLYAALYGYGANETKDIYGNNITMTNNRENPGLGDYWQTTLYYNAKFTNLYHYNGYEALQSAKRDFSSFSSDYWVVDNDKIVWKSQFAKNLEVKFFDNSTDLGEDAKLVGLNKELSMKAFAEGEDISISSIEVEENDYVVYDGVKDVIRLAQLPVGGAVNVKLSVTVVVGGVKVTKTISIMAMGGLVNVEKVYDLVDESTGMLAGNAFPMNEIVGDNEILSIYQGEKLITYNAQSGALNGLTANITGEGENREVLPVELTINTEDTIYIVKVKVYSKVIATAKDLQYFNQTLAENANNSYNGYYILTNNLSDFTSVYNDAADSNHGLKSFTGTFDGNGYSISSKVNKGFFGVLGHGAVVKNVAFTNMQFPFNFNSDLDGKMTSGYYGTTAIIAGFINNATDVVIVKDVYINLDESVNCGYRQYLSKWITSAILVNANASLKSKFSNIVIEANIYHSDYNDSANGAGAQPCLFSYWNGIDLSTTLGQYANGTTADALTNVYVISKDKTNNGGLFRITAGRNRTSQGMVLSYNDYNVVAGGSDAYAKNYLPSTYNNGSKEIVTMRRYNDYNAMASDNNDYSLFNSNCWDLTGSTPVWKNK
ncbi:MAG: Ig-like domain-containing protein [Clostridia bacterium]|nr:Ig-like domain-containing protein [Clostridia bacterium]